MPSSAYEIPSLRFSAVAGAAIARRRFITINSSEKGIYPTAGDGGVVGVSWNDPKIDEVLEIVDGITIVEANGIIAAGAGVQVGADGKAVVLSAGERVGTAMTGSAAAGELITVKL